MTKKQDKFPLLKQFTVLCTLNNLNVRNVMKIGNFKSSNLTRAFVWEVMFVLLSIGQVNANPQISVKFLPIAASSSALTYRLYLSANGSGHVLNSCNIYLAYDPTNISYSSCSFKDSFNSSRSPGSTHYASSSITDLGTGSGGVEGNNDAYGIGYQDIDINLSNQSTNTGSAISNGGWSSICDVTFSVIHSGGTPSPFIWDEILQSPLVAGYNYVASDYPLQDYGIYETSTTYFDNSATWASSITPVALPVNLLNFSALYNNGEVAINWSTASETNNSLFTVERSQDGKHFEAILYKAGSGTTTTRRNYSVYDESPLMGTSYYRLRQTDFNGFSNVFNIAAINNTANGIFAIQNITPTNFTDNCNLNYKMPEQGCVELVVTNSMGRLVKDELVSSVAGDNTYRLSNTNSWVQGIYFVQLKYNGKVVFDKMIKQ